MSREAVMGENKTSSLKFRIGRYQRRSTWAFGDSDMLHGGVTGEVNYQGRAVRGFQAEKLVCDFLGNSYVSTLQSNIV